MQALTCSSAAEGGHLHILQWARSEGCPWIWITCDVATKRGRLHISWNGLEVMGVLRRSGLKAMLDIDLRASFVLNY